MTPPDPFAEIVEAHRIRELEQALASSDVVISAWSPGAETSVKYALELGLSILHDKPIVVVASPGQIVPPRLAQVADMVVFGDLDTPSGAARVQAALAAFLEETS